MDSVSPLKELWNTAGQRVPQLLVRGQDRNGVCLVLADSRLQENLRKKMAQRELETKSSVWNTGLQDIPMLLCSCFFSNLLTEMLKYITISPWNEEGLRPIAEYNWIFSLSRKQPELNWRMSQSLSHSQEQTHSHFMRVLHYTSAHITWFSVLLEAVPSICVFMLQHWWWWWWWWWFRYKIWKFLNKYILLQMCTSQFTLKLSIIFI